MPILDRYRKAGGFVQLVQLIESCEPNKQEKLLHLVGAEDPGWAVLVKAKSLSLNKIFSWPQQSLMEFTNIIPDRILAITLHCVPADFHPKIIESLPRSKAREVQTLFEEIKPTPAEKHAATVKVIQTVRDFEKDGKIKLAAIDPSLEINELLVA